MAKLCDKNWCINPKLDSAENKESVIYLLQVHIVYWKSSDYHVLSFIQALSEHTPTQPVIPTCISLPYAIYATPLVMRSRPPWPNTPPTTFATVTCGRGLRPYRPGDHLVTLDRCPSKRNVMGHSMFSAQYGSYL